MNTLKVHTRFGEYDCHINMGKYNNDNICLSLSTAEHLPFATLTVNLGKVDKGYAYLDTNNSPFVQHLFKKYNLGEYADYNMISGWCVYPLYKLNIEEIKKYIKSV